MCPARDTGVALVMTRLDTKAMNLFLAELAQAVAPGAHAVVLMDKAGWHIAGDLVIPANLTPVFLPPYSPELNPIERLWLYLKDNHIPGRFTYKKTHQRFPFGNHEHPLVDPQVSHFRQVPLRTRVKLPHSPQLSPS